MVFLHMVYAVWSSYATFKKRAPDMLSCISSLWELTLAGSFLQPAHHGDQILSPPGQIWHGNKEITMRIRGIGFFILLLTLDLEINFDMLFFYQKRI